MSNNAHFQATYTVKVLTDDWKLSMFKLGPVRQTLKDAVQDAISGLEQLKLEEWSSTYQLIGVGWVTDEGISYLETEWPGRIPYLLQ